MNDNKMSTIIVDQLRAELIIRYGDVTSAAEGLGVSYTTLYRYLRGERDMPLVWLLNALEALGISLSEFVARVEARA